MFPAQTSFIPITVALTKFIVENGFGGHYPYWYLGSTPLKYLIGPVVPIILGGFSSLTGLSLFNLSLIFVVFCIFFQAIGWGIFSTAISDKPKLGLLVALLGLILPWHWFWALGLSEVSALLTVSLTPWLLWVYFRFVVGQFSVYKISLAIFGLLIIFLINTTASVSALFSLIILAVVVEKPLILGLKKVFLVIFVSWLLSFGWYGYGYWLTIFSAPTIGGQGYLSLIGSLMGFIRSFVPVVLAVVVVWLKIKPKSAFEKFILVWLVVFTTLTIFRLIVDVDFWMDWTAWFWEVEIGLVLLVGLLVSRIVGRWNFKLKFNKSSIIYLLLAIYFVGCWYLALSHLSFWVPRKNISDSVEQKIANELEKNVDSSKTVFLSGSTAFWLNTFEDIKQVRGGRDEASVDSRWREVVWRVRQGNNVNEAIHGLEALGVDYLVVHSSESMEYYHDFKNPEIFSGNNGLKMVYSESGNVIYELIKF